MGEPTTTLIPDFVIRKASTTEAHLILKFIKDIAEYEKLSHEVVATLDDIQKTFFCEHPNVFCVISYYQNRAVGFAVYFFNFSTFLCKHGLYLEDLFVLPEYRGKGFGKAMLLHLTQLALQNNCGRMEWSVLDWNTPAIEFYKSLQAKPLNGWTIFRLTETTLKQLN